MEAGKVCEETQVGSRRPGVDKSEDKRRERAVANKEGRGGVAREVLEGIKDERKVREGMGRAPQLGEEVSCRWRVRAVSIMAVGYSWRLRLRLIPR